MDTLAARQQMVDRQIRTWEVLDPRSARCITSPPCRVKHLLPPDCNQLAFADAAIPDEFGQSMLAPKIRGRILPSLERGPRTDTVLEVGSGNEATSSACLGLLGSPSSTRSIDIHPQFAAAAQANLRVVAGAKVEFETHDGWPPPPWAKAERHRGNHFAAGLRHF